MIRVIIPYHLKTLSSVTGEVQLDVAAPVTLRAVLDALETRYPARRFAEALPVARANDLEAAVLDINLNGELVYPVAAALVERGVPIVFVTGYGAESIDRQFSQIPVLQKPIERKVLESFFAVNANSSVRHNDIAAHAGDGRSAAHAKREARPV